MEAPSRGLVARCLLLWSTATALVLVLVGTCLAELLRPLPSGEATVEDALVRGAAVLALVGLPHVWWAVTSTSWRLAAGTLTRAPSSLLRRGVVLACGGALALSALTPAQAGAPEGRDASPQQLLHGLPMPERASLPAATPPAPAQPRPGNHPRHRVRGGESLWSIAADRLAAGDEASVDALWRRIHALNLEVIGQDPDLIHPGQSLRLPGTTTTAPTRPATGHDHQGDRP